ncbi:MAG: FkbM family methyltransferase [Bacteroidetes bacterium]|nr:FkbM family methyltransferase [Bacteroidota bacterium]
MKARIYSLIIKTWQHIPFKKQIIFLLKQMNLSFEKYIKDLWFNGKFKVNILDTSFYLYSNRIDKGMFEIYYEGIDKCWDANSIIIWGKLCKKSQNIFDIGANFGLYSMVAKAVNPEANVYSFEPSKFAFDLINKNLKINNFNINVFDFAISNTNGSKTFFESEKSSAASSFVVQETQQNSFSTREVITHTFKNFIDQHDIKTIDLISIDVESYESEVLEGMENIISEFLPNFIIEVLNNELGKKIEKYFANKNYLYYEINEKDMTVMLRDNLYRVDENRYHSYNFLICTLETASYLKLETPN